MTCTTKNAVNGSILGSGIPLSEKLQVKPYMLIIHMGLKSRGNERYSLMDIKSGWVSQVRIYNVTCTNLHKLACLCNVYKVDKEYKEYNYYQNKKR